MFRFFLTSGRNVHLCAAPHEVERNVQTDAGTFKGMVSQTKGVKVGFISESAVRAAATSPMK
jgi:hypothetical protein